MRLYHFPFYFYYSSTTDSLSHLLLLLWVGGGGGCNRKSLQPRHLRCLGLFSPHVKLNQIAVKLQSNWARRAEAPQGPRHGCSTTTITRPPCHPVAVISTAHRSHECFGQRGRRPAPARNVLLPDAEHLAPVLQGYFPLRQPSPQNRQLSTIGTRGIRMHVNLVSKSKKTSLQKTMNHVDTTLAASPVK